MLTRRQLIQSVALLPASGYLLSVDSVHAAQTKSAATQHNSTSVTFADFENGWGDWTVEGNAFGDAPATNALFPGKIHGFSGRGFVCTLHPRHGVSATGRAISPEFTIEKPFITFKIGGGHFPGQACLNLVVEGQVIHTATGEGSADLTDASWDVSALTGKKAHLEIIDSTTSLDRGYIMVDQICFNEAVPYSINRKVTGRWRIHLTTTHGPFQGTVLYPVPPNDPCQTILSSRLTLEGGQGRREATVIHDNKTLHQPVYQIAVSETGAFTATVEVDVEFYDCALTLNNAVTEPTPLSPVERNEALADGWDTEEERLWYTNWMKSERLIREAGESDMAFAYRILEFLHKNFTYKIPDDLDDYRTAVRQEGDFGSWKYCMATRSGECWRLSEIYTRILRMNNAPVRILSGNLIGRQSGHHVRTLVWFEGVGWTPVEPTATTSDKSAMPSRYFGNWSGTILSGNANIGFSVPANGKSFNIGTFDCLWFVPAEGNAEPYSTFTSDQLA